MTRAAALVLLLTLALPASAQVVVRVRSDNAPVRDVELVMLAGGARLAAARTGIAGEATLRVHRPLAADAVLLARRLGFVARQVAIGQHDTITVDLQAVAAELPVLAVRSYALRCPVEGSADAERLVATAARGYGQGQDALKMGALRHYADEDVEPQRRGYGEAPRDRRAMGGYGPSIWELPLLFRSPTTYAEWNDRRGWTYAPLHNRGAEHFSNPEFRARNAFVVLDTNAGVTVVGFCPRSRSEPGIQGEIGIGPDNRFQAARWSFVVPHDDDDAGGEVTFGIATYERKPYLVAVRGSTWRRNGRRMYLQHSFELDSWRLGRTDAEITTGWTPLGDVNARPTP